MAELKFIKIFFLIMTPVFILFPLNNLESSAGTTKSTWPTATPESQGIDSKQLARIFDYVKENEINIHSIVLTRNGNLVLEAYFYPNSKGIVHDVASVTKSITSILIGMAIEKGYIKSVHQPVLDFFPDRKIANLDDRKKRLTIEHLLTMRTGFCRNFEQGEQQLDDMRRTNDWVQYMLDQPLLAEPGGEFAYCTGGTHLLSAIITRATNMNELEFARKYLFDPLDIHEVFWRVDSSGNNTGGFDLYMQSLDMAKIGYLLLNDGIWAAQQIVSKKWIEQSTRFVDLDGDERYGYLWWSPGENPDLVEGRGRGGQRLIYSAQRNIILVMTGSGFDPGDIGGILLPAIKAKHALPENPTAFKLLKEKIEAAEKAPEPAPVPELPAVAAEISGKTYEFEPNSVGWISFSLIFNNGAEAILKLTEDDHYEENRIGLDNLYRISNSGSYGTPEALKGSWISNNQFEIIYNEFAGNHIYRISFSFPFDNNIAKVHAVEGTGLFDTTVLARLVK